jgi:SNF2 family DNA or RNA helicase
MQPIRPSRPSLPLKATRWESAPTRLPSPLNTPRTRSHHRPHIGQTESRLLLESPPLPPSPEQKACYRAILEQNRSLLLSGADARTGPSFLNVHMQLRHCCNHPFLIKGVADAQGVRNARPLENACTSRYSLNPRRRIYQSPLPSRYAPSQPPAPPRPLPDVAYLDRLAQPPPDIFPHASPPPPQVSSLPDDAYLDRLVHSSGKLVLLDKLLPSLHQKQHRVLLFSQVRGYRGGELAEKGGALISSQK